MITTKIGSSKKKNPTNSLLWEIANDAWDHTSFLLGTIHISTQFAFSYFDQYKLLIQQCAVYAGESDLDELANIALPGQMDPSYQQLYQQYLSANQYQHLHRFVRTHVPQIEAMWPVLHPLLLLSQMEASLVGSNHHETLDKALWNFAKAEGKVLTSIESAGMQQQIFEDIDLDTAFKGIKAAISSMSSFRKRYLKLAEYYENHDIQSLYKTARKQLSKAKHPMLYDRNFFMADRIEELISAQSCFIGIGVGHLPGQKGVLRLLKQKGFRVQPVKLTQDLLTL